MTPAHRLVGVLLSGRWWAQAGLRGGRYRVIGTPNTRREGKDRRLSRRNGSPSYWVVRRGFNLVELVVVLAVAVVLTGLMLPAMSHVRENLHRIICSSNLRQLGMSFQSFASDNKDQLPHTVLLEVELYQPQELMAVYLGGDLAPAPNGWDGLGLLYSMGYCTAPGVFYCPSHTGDHPSERYPNDLWKDPGTERIYSNYHYAGDVEWSGGESARARSIDSVLLLATDGLRDFNHGTSMNVLAGDGSVRWRDIPPSIYLQLSVDPNEDPEATAARYSNLWRAIENMHHP